MGGLLVFTNLKTPWTMYPVDSAVLRVNLFQTDCFGHCPASMGWSKSSMLSRITLTSPYTLRGRRYPSSSLGMTVTKGITLIMVTITMFLSGITNEVGPKNPSMRTSQEGPESHSLQGHHGYLRTCITQIHPISWNQYF